MASPEATRSPERDGCVQDVEHDMDRVTLGLSELVVQSAPQDVAAQPASSSLDTPPPTPECDECEGAELANNTAARQGIKKPTTVGVYELLCTIGVGAYSKVKLVKHRRTGEVFAMKIMPNTPSQAFQPANEILAMQRVHMHPNVVTLHKVLASSSRLFLVMDYASKGDLFEAIVGSPLKRLDEALSRHYFQQLVHALEYLHLNGVCHRDIKAENCLLTEQGALLLSDFGFSKMFQPNERPSSTRRCGTANYVAPEMLQLSQLGSFDPFKTDIWACGVLLFFMLSGFLPFDSSKADKIFLKIQACNPPFPPHITPQAKSLIMSILNPSPATRASLAAIKQHPWMQEQPLVPVTEFESSS